MRLQQNQFIRQILLEDARLMVGSRVYFDGTTWEAVEQKTDGWLWRVVSGRNPNWNPEVDTKFFRFPGSVFANSIYNQPNVDNSYVTNGKQEVKDGEFAPPGPSAVPSATPGRGGWWSPWPGP